MYDWYEYRPTWHGVETRFSIPITQETHTLTFEILENLEYVLYADIRRRDDTLDQEAIISPLSVNFKVELPEIIGNYRIYPKIPCGAVSNAPIEIDRLLPMTEDYYAVENYHS